MAELSAHIKYALDAIARCGSKWQSTSPVEGPRRIGHCAYCKGQCSGVTANCELRVWQESTCPYKDSHLKKF